MTEMEVVDVPVGVAWFFVSFAGFGRDADARELCCPLLAHPKPCSWQAAVETCSSGSPSFPGCKPEAGFPHLQLSLACPFRALSTEGGVSLQD